MFHIRITPVIKSPFIPSIQIPIPSEIVKIFLETPNIRATIVANKADWNKTTEASAFEKAACIPAKLKGVLFISSIIAKSSPPIIVTHPL